MQGNEDTNLANRQWLAIGMLIAILLSLSAVISTWPKIAPAYQAQISFLAYCAYILFSFTLWVGIAVFINALRCRIPLFDTRRPKWFYYHLLVSMFIGAGHLLIDTLLLWTVFHWQFPFVPAYLAKLVRWMPFEMLGYWACLGFFTLVASHRQNRQEPPTYLQQLAVKHQGKTVVLACSDLACLEAYDNYVFVYAGEQKYMLHTSLSALETQLDPSRFARIHRACIVNLAQVSEFQNSAKGQLEMRLKNGHMVTASRRQAPSVRARFRSTNSFLNA